MNSCRQVELSWLVERRPYRDEWRDALSFELGKRGVTNVEKPIWLAQGPAWTGISLADVTLDTVIVTRYPFSPPKPQQSSAPNVVSSADAYVHWEMLMRLKQGIGRAVRTRKATPKTIWIFDGRKKPHTLALFRQYKTKKFD